MQRKFVRRGCRGLALECSFSRAQEVSQRGWTKVEQDWKRIFAFQKLKSYQGERNAKLESDFDEIISDLHDGLRDAFVVRNLWL